ncbi:MAG: IS110 family transposase, partial [Clostridia bacterium]
VITYYLSFGSINKEVYLDDYRYKALLNLTRARFFAIQNLDKEQQRFLNYLFNEYSTIAQEEIFSDAFITTALAVYEELGSAEPLLRWTYNSLPLLLSRK